MLNVIFICINLVYCKFYEYNPFFIEAELSHLLPLLKLRVLKTSFCAVPICWLTLICNRLKNEVEWAHQMELSIGTY